MSKRILTLFAHPDDAETMAGGTLLKWAAEGHAITLCLITDGDKGTADPADTSAAVIARRRAEQARAAARLGADVITLGYEDGMLQPTLDLRRDLVRVMRRVRPDLVVANDPTVWFRHGTYINHPDHRAAGHAAVEALYPAVKKASIFPELIAEGLQPHVVPEVWLGPTGEADTWVDIAGVFEEKVALICEHASQFPPEPTRAAFERMAREVGQERGLALAESFRTLHLRASTVRALAGAPPAS
ncbi:MAG: PIG-L family deacetylase [Thermoanaerobaculaceae bacterium]|nr:PIG-L family deacetylase [Thermoanaerobaculaceae bacterium]TAM49814.1 MAG: PIG-L family deacetylase [Acidobacteriota bacterium]